MAFDYAKKYSISTTTEYAVGIDTFSNVEYSIPDNLEDLEVNNIKINQAIYDAFATTGISGQVLLTDSTKAYWGNVSAGSSITGIGINSNGQNIGYGATILDFRGVGVSSVTFNTGTATIYIEGGGSQGLQGITGSQGTQGISVQGTQGTTGSQGTQGISVQGTQGTIGSQGTQGISVQGTQGITGSQGTQGTTGSQGTQGITGSQGTQGTTGSQGTQGTTGSQGTQGISVQGTQGITGSQGTQGTTGSQGTQGITGSQGIQGSSGPSSTINAADDTTTATLYPVMVGATGSNQTAKARSTATAFSFNASTNVLSANAVKSNIYYGVGTTNGVTGISHVTDSTQPSIYFWGQDYPLYEGQVHIIGRSSNASSASGQIRFYDYTGSTWNLNMVIDKDANVLLGGTTSSTGTASQPLQVNGGAYVSGNLGVGATNPASVIETLKNWGSVSSTNLSFTATSYADASRFALRRANGTPSVPTTILNGEELGNFNFRGHDGTAFSTGGLANIGADAEENYTITSRATRLRFGTTNVNETSVGARMYLTGAGELLIGAVGTKTGTASQLLQVSGGGYFSGAVGIGTTNPLSGTSAFHVNFASYHGVSGDALLRLVSIGGINYLQSGVTATANSAAPLVFSTLFNGTEWARFASTGQFLLGGTTTPTGTASQPLQVTGGAYVSGNLGVGATNPKAALQVSSNFLSSANPTLGVATGNVYITNADTTYGLLIGNSSSLGHTWLQAQRTDGTALAYNLVLEPSGGNVGVGTVPETKLEVDGNLLVSTYNLGNDNGIFFRRGFASTNKYNLSILAYDHSSSGASPDGLSINAFDGVSFCTGLNTRQERVRIDTSGNVGIGSTNPAQKLDVVGIGQFRNNGASLNLIGTDHTYIQWYPDGVAAGRKAYTGFSGSAANYFEIANEISDGSGHIYLNPGTSAAVLIESFTATGTASQTLQVTGGAYVSGNLGVGVTNPIYGVHIQGTSIAEIGFTATGAGGDNFRIGSGSNAAGFDGLRVYDVNAAAERLRVDSSGNIVINSTTATGTASQPLQVSGGGYFAGVGVATGSIGVGITNPQGAIDIRTSPQWNGFNWGANLVIGGSRNNGLVILDSGNTNPWGISNGAGNLNFGYGPALGDTTNPVSTILTLHKSSSSVLIGSLTPTGTASQPLQVTGGAYVSGNVGIGTTNPTQILDVRGNAIIGAQVSGVTATPPYLSLGANYTSTYLRANCKIRVFDGGGGDVYGFNVGPAGDVQYHSTNTHQFYNSDVATLLVNGTAPSYKGNTIWHAGNDGSGSGLDADTLDSYNTGTSGSAIPLLNGSNTWSGSQYFNGTFSAEAQSKADITTRTVGGFWQTDTATTAEGWPVTSNSWYHLLCSTHSNTANHYSMQFAGDFFNSSDIYYRSTNNSGTTAWNKMWHAGNDGSGSGLDADLLDGLNSATTNTASTIVSRDGSGNFAAGTITAALSGNATTATTLQTAREIGGTSFDGSADITPFRANTLPTVDGGTIRVSSTTYAARNAASTPNQYQHGVNWEFKNASVVSGTGNYAGLLTLAPWISTTSSTGDPSYQLAFSPAAANSTSPPTIQTRAGIDTTWGSWSTIWHSGNDGAGSGLDADTLDSLSSTSFLRSDANQTGTGAYLFNRNNPAISNTSYATPNNHIELRTTDASNPIIGFHRSGFTATALYHSGYGTNSLRIRNADGADGEIWWAGNDGSGSGLDADLLDGLNSATTNTASTIVSRDSDGGFSAGIITATTFRARGGAPGVFGANNNGYGFFGSGDNDSGMYSSADGQIEFYSNATEAARITSNRNLLIGATSETGTASQRLQVTGGGYFSGVVGIGTTIGTTYPTTTLQVIGDTLIVGVATANSFRARGGAPGIAGVNNNGYGFFSPGDRDSGMYSSANGQIEFYSSGTEAIRVSLGGSTGIGITNPARRLHVNGGIRNTARNAASTQTALHINTTTGDIAETASSRRFKRNIQDYTKGLETIVQLRSVSFNFLEDDLPNTGLIAEEVNEIGLPEFIRYDADNNPYSIPYDNLSALYINSIKQLKVENDALKIRLRALEEYVGIGTS